MPRPDFSEYVVHFTKSDRPHCASRADAPDFIPSISQMTTPLARLAAILGERRIRATPMPWTGSPSVCFTECVWGSLLHHAATYSPYGVGFAKSFLFSAGGGPAFYVRQDLYHAQRARGAPYDGWAAEVWPFLTPFKPPYASPEHRAAYWTDAREIDYTREREWRVPHDLLFELEEVAFVIVASRDDEETLAEPLAAALGGDRILRMDNYSRISELWPWHQ